MGKAGFVGPGSERYGGRAGLARGCEGRIRRAALSPVAQPPGVEVRTEFPGTHNRAPDVERAEITPDD